MTNFAPEKYDDSLIQFTIAEFAQYLDVTTVAVRRMILEDRLPSGFRVCKISARKRKIVKENKKTEYRHASELSPEKILEINKCVDNLDFRRKNGNPNIRKIAKYVNENYTTVYRFLNNQYKSKKESREDKGHSRALSEKEEKRAYELFKTLLLENVQRNVKLTREKVFNNSGIVIPQRLAYKWGRELKALHKQKHYYSLFENQNTPFTIRDLWKEYTGLLSCVVADEWKVDEYGVWYSCKSKGYENIKATAYIVMFQDMKTRKPLRVIMAPHSITTADTKRAAMELVREYGRPQQWIFENSKTWKNAEFLRFIMGLYADKEDLKGCSNIEFMDLDMLKVIEKETDFVIRSGVRHPQSKPVERTFRILKDEFCAYSPAYSPNMKESRKPSRRESHPEICRTYEELRRDLTMFLEHDFLDRERTMFFDRTLSRAHEINKARPKTIREAFDRAYSYFEADKIDSFRLAYLYAEKYKAKFTGGAFTFMYKPLLEKRSLVPIDMDKIYDYMGEELVALIDQYDTYHGWIFTKDGKLLSEAKDLSAFGPQSREQANEIGKLKRQYIKANKDQIKAAEAYKKAKEVKVFQYERVMESPVGNIEDNTDDNSAEYYEETVSPEPDSGINGMDIFNDTSLIEF